MAGASALGRSGSLRGRKYAKDHARRPAALPVRQHDLQGHRCPDRLAFRAARGAGFREFPRRLRDRRSARGRGTRELAEIARADVFIVSDRLVTLMMCQVSEELIDPEGSELYLKPANEYVKPGVALDFYTIVAAARRRGRLQGEGGSRRPAKVLRRAPEPGQIPAGRAHGRGQGDSAGRVLNPNLVTTLRRLNPYRWPR